MILNKYDFEEYFNGLFYQQRLLPVEFYLAYFSFKNDLLDDFNVLLYNACDDSMRIQYWSDLMVIMNNNE